MPGIFEKARFKLHGWFDAIDQKNEDLLFKAIEDGKLGLNHDSRASLLKRAIDNDMWEFATELIRRGISDARNFDVLVSLANKDAWVVFDSIMESIKSIANHNNFEWIKDIEGIRMDATFLQELDLKEEFFSIIRALENNNRDEIRGSLKKIKKIIDLRDLVLKIVST